MAAHRSPKTARSGWSEPEMQSPARRLAAPARRLNLQELAAGWYQSVVSARIPGYGVLAHDLDLLRRLRGAIGDLLLAGASPEAIAGHPCSWQPPCGLDILFREQGRRGGHGIPKPYVLKADRSGADLVLSMTLFGFASDWAGVAQHVFATAVQHGIDWRGQRSELFLPAAQLAELTVTSGEGLAVPRPPTVALIEFLTPMNAEGDDPIDRPATVFARLARRIEGLAAWQDAALDEDWQALSRVSQSLSYDATMLRRRSRDRHSGRARRHFTVDAIDGSLQIADLPPPLWVLLLIGSITHVGKGATEGFGRFQLG
jgi:hypothetical protein